MSATFPNTFLIGVQKAGTTTLDDWLSQHPDIYCYDSLKDVHLFYRFNSREEMEKRMAIESPPYKGQKIVLQSAVNYIFYESMLQGIQSYAPEAKLLLILRHPADRAISAYQYFCKMQRETRGVNEALLYEMKFGHMFSHDNSDFTYLEHGMYGRQVEILLSYFSKHQLLVLDYDDLRSQPQRLMYEINSFLGIDVSFVPDFSPKNVTGTVKSQALQHTVLSHNKYRKWIVDHIVDPVFPVTRRKALKQKIFEWNTDRKTKAHHLKQSVTDDLIKEDMNTVRQKIAPLFKDDVRKLDKLLHTDFHAKWYPS
jgi:hypothetical protein